MLRVQACLDDGMALGVLGDRTLGGDRRHACPSWGGRRVSDGAVAHGGHAGRPVVFMVGLYLGGNRYAIRFERLADLVRSNGATATPRSSGGRGLRRLFERHCRAAPCNWFNFFDFWRPKDAAKT